MRKVTSFFIAFCLLLLAGCGPADMASRGGPDERGGIYEGTMDLGTMRSEQRVALVIGNNDYGALAPLNNAVRDARSVSTKLEEKGFEVTLVENQDLQQMRRAVIEFQNTLKAGGIGLFFFAGHGFEVNGTNFLMPVNAQADTADLLEADGLKLQWVLEKLGSAGNRMNIVVMDSCRSDPFKGRPKPPTDTRGPLSSRGLLQADPPRGTFIAYATSPGSIALDGQKGGNGLFTKAFLMALDKPQRLEDVFKETLGEVIFQSKSRQKPWTAAALTKGDFYFTFPEVCEEGEVMLDGHCSSLCGPGTHFDSGAKVCLADKAPEGGRVEARSDGASKVDVVVVEGCAVWEEEKKGGCLQVDATKTSRAWRSRTKTDVRKHLDDFESARSRPSLAVKHLDLALKAWSKGDPDSRDKDVGAEIHFFKGELASLKFQALPLKNLEKLEKELVSKAGHLQEAQEHYEKAVQLNSRLWSVAAANRIGQMYREFSDGLYAYSLPEDLPEEHIDEYRSAIDDFSFPLLEKALEAAQRAQDLSLRLGSFNEWSLKTAREISRLEAEKYPLAVLDGLGTDHRIEFEGVPEDVESIEERVLSVVAVRGGRLAPGEPLADWFLVNSRVVLDESRRRQVAALLNNLGVAYLRNGVSEDALRCFEAAVLFAPGFKQPRLNLGALSLKRLDYGLMLKSYTRVLKSEPGNCEARLGAATGNYGVGKSDTAVVGYNWYLEHCEAATPSAHLQLMRIYERKGEYEEAARYCRKLFSSSKAEAMSGTTASHCVALDKMKRVDR